MGRISTTGHLFDPPKYIASGKVSDSFAQAVADAPSTLTWDPTAILGILSYGYSTGDRTVFREVTTHPWLSEVSSAGDIRLLPIPPHDTVNLNAKQIAARLLERLHEEAVRVCQERKQLYILLSGGLDSRIVAGVIARAMQRGDIQARCTAITWGKPESRDVVYGRATAQILGMEWQHVELGPQDLVDNVFLMASALGCAALPIHLHAMRWFSNCAQDALVLAGSYGDSVGRAEFSGTHVLSLRRLRPINPMSLLTPAAAAEAAEGFAADVAALHARTPGVPAYVLREHEMQGIYMRNLIGRVMAIIGSYCDLYQMFTSPSVFGFMWSIHPSLRNNEPYAELLEMLHPRLARLPWARTNRALRGPTEGVDPNAPKQFHEYRRWSREVAFGQLRQYIDPEWFAATGIFDPGRVRYLTEHMQEARPSLRYAEGRPESAWLWLASLRILADSLAQQGKRIGWEAQTSGRSLVAPPEGQHSLLRRVVRTVPICRNVVRQWRNAQAKRRAWRQFPPRDPDDVSMESVTANA